jgi:translation initiation factor IF-3
MWWAREARMTYINEMIKAPKVMLIDENGEQLGTVSRDEALRRASALGLDLVQVAYNPLDMLCTAKIIDYGKYMYDKSKDDKEKKKNNKSKWSKEIKMSYTIWDNDLALKVKKAEEFLDEWYTVRFSVRLKWREKIFVSKVVERLKGIEATMAEKSKSQGVKEEPNGISLFLLPKGR